MKEDSWKLLRQPKANDLHAEFLSMFEKINFWLSYKACDVHWKGKVRKLSTLESPL